jgi:O-antigen/teichoic acid export membrane protein
MGIVFRQSAKNVIVAVFGVFLGALIIWLSTRYISKQQYGFLLNFSIYAVTLAQILLLGLNNTLVVYVHRYAGDNRKKQALLTMCLVLPLIVAIIFAIVFYLFKEPVLHHFQPDDAVYMRRYYMWLPLFTILFIYLIMLEQYLGSQLKVAVSAFMREVVLRLLSIGLIILFIYNIIGFHGLFTGNILIYIVPVLVFLFLSLRTEGFGITFRQGALSRSEYKDIIGFSWYHFLFTVAAILMGSLDMLLLPFYDHNGFRSVAVYRVSVFLISFIQLPLKAMIPASFAVLARAFSDGDMVKARDIFTRSSVNIFIATVFIAVVLCCNIVNIMVIINKGYAEVVPVFIILLVSALINVATGMNDQVLSIANYYKFNFYLSLILMVVLFVLMRTFIPRYGIYGAAWSTTIGIVVFNLAKFLFVWKKVGMQPFARGTALVLVAGAVAFAAGYFFPHFFDQSRHMYVRTFVDVIIRSFLIVIVYLGMLLWLKPSKDLEEYIGQIRKNKRLF